MLCPSHRVSLIPKTAFVPMCDLCLRSCAVFGCPECSYRVCKWCFLGGNELVERVAGAQRALTDMRREVEDFKCRVDGDLYAWV